MKKTNKVTFRLTGPADAALPDSNYVNKIPLSPNPRKRKLHEVSGESLQPTLSDSKRRRLQPLSVHEVSAFLQQSIEAR